MEEFQAKVGLVAEVIKGSLESFNLYIAVDPKTEEFIFIDFEEAKATIESYIKLT